MADPQLGQAEASAAAKAAGPSAPSAAPAAKPDEGRMGARPGEGLSTDATASAASEARVMRHELLFEAHQNAEYHGCREGFLLSLNRVLQLASVLTGTAAFGAIMGSVGQPVALSAAFLAALASGVSLVFNLSARANQHAVLRGRYQTLCGRIQAAPADELAQLRSEMTTIYPSEPPAYKAMLALAYNAAIDRLYAGASAAPHRLVVSRRDRFLGNVLRMSTKSFDPV